ncbi:MAG: ABC transporter ATP-binding protein [Candidatus Riflebacteria bacterium]|nr:ABC transporter ATP-binding protein [Candidatus Riflebacteria bacterium]
MIGISKRFKTVVANRQANLTVNEREIHAVVGENGAGKSTLMNILYGLYRQDEGEVRVFGQKVEDHGPTNAVRLGIGMVHQHFMLVPPFSVIENIILGIEESAGPFLDPSRIARQVVELGDRYGLKVDLEAKVQTLPVSMEQRVEILKVLVRGARVLILDEPTAVLTPQEVEEFFKVLRTLRDQGSTIILITHKLKEIKAISDRLTVMREGTTVATAATGDVSREEIAQLMVGRPVRFAVEKKDRPPGEVRLVAKNVGYTSAGRRLLDGVDLSICSGEILGLAGVAGNGQTELVQGFTGLIQGLEGSIELDGRDLSGLSVRERIELGLGHIAEDRLKHALVPDYSIEDNFALGLHHRPPCTSLGRLMRSAIRAQAERLIGEYDVRPPLPELPARQLSGGNQQKVVIGRECSREPRCLIAALPTRGVDIGAIEFIHQRLVGLRDRGVAILLVSTELSEILSLSDRIAVIYRGKILKTLHAAEATESVLGLAMAGVA